MYNWRDYINKLSIPSWKVEKITASRSSAERWAVNEIVPFLFLHHLAVTKILCNIQASNLIGFQEHGRVPHGICQWFFGNSGSDINPATNWSFRE